MKKKVKELQFYRDIQVDSQEEIYFLQWLQEFREAGVIETIERSRSFLLSNPYIEKQTIQLKTKTKKVDKTILHGHIYTPEFRVKVVPFNYPGDIPKKDNPFSISLELFKLFRDTFINDSVLETGDYFYFEVKPQWDQNNMTRLFKINQKWVWDKYQVFINLVKPIELFEKTFIPKECVSDFFYKVRTKKNKIGDKKYNWEYRTFEEWITTL